MTRDEELAKLVAEQEADDTYFVRGHQGQVDIDALDNYVTTDDEGYVICTLPPERGTRLMQPANIEETWHGTFGGYTNHGCRCDRCRVANREHIAKRRAG